jgi:hypothetical protein
MANNFPEEQKFLLIKKIDEEKNETGKISEKTKRFVEFFYDWRFQYIGYYAALTEFGRMK